ncbi:hypothetical protein [Candidatus Berkiella aquae]|uniref:Antitoxin HicB n=1 Tax=Candidatus Berkiella aquae TaxID=295108 RepID=A0A0Q9YZA7_9GAMM|nr:hypothetical protein [Candidatus Berkiella aquae]MCS5711469.1 hypothetical protein [Candidatus Berkiella aquae]
MIASFAYPMKISSENNNFILSFEHFPEITTWAESEEEILEVARDALEAALAGRIIRKENIPLPGNSILSSQTKLVPVPILIATKAWLFHLMKSKNISNSELARILKIKSEKTIRRLLDPKENSKILSIEEAILKLGGFPYLSFELKEKEGSRKSFTPSYTNKNDSIKEKDVLVQETSKKPYGTA